MTVVSAIRPTRRSRSAKLRGAPTARGQTLLAGHSACDVAWGAEASNPRADERSPHDARRDKRPALGLRKRGRPSLGNLLANLFRTSLQPAKSTRLRARTGLPPSGPDRTAGRRTPPRGSAGSAPRRWPRRRTAGPPGGRGHTPPPPGASGLCGRRPYGRLPPLALGPWQRPSGARPRTSP